ncbi:MAG: phosphotransferase family protein [Hyphomicrobiales bacterium]|nr:phosphotransferase family protein [Hyphomicrobiales bacterium]
MSETGEPRESFSFADRALAVVRRFAPDAERLEKVVRLSGGASQETWSLVAIRNGSPERMILRRMPAGVPVVEKIGLETEAALMRAAEAAGVPSPHVHYVVQPDDGFGRGFFMSHVEGEALGRKIVRDEQFAAIRPKLARQAGETLARIHAIDVASLPQLPLVKPAQEITTMFANYRAWSEPRPVFELAFRWLSERMPPENAALKLVHGDFRNGNMMISPNGITAVLDWELAHIGDPMRDLGWICTAAWRYSVIDKPVGGFGEREDLMAGYEAAGGGRVDPNVLRFWETLGSLRWGVMCIGMGFRAKQSDRPVEMSMIARRTSENEIDLMRLLAPRGD